MIMNIDRPSFRSNENHESHLSVLLWDAGRRLAENAFHGREVAASMRKTQFIKTLKEFCHVDQTRIHRNALWL